MKILVMGNINSGKSRFIDGFLLTHGSYIDIRIDEYRQRYSDGTVDGEMDTQSRFISDVISAEDDIIAELTGLGFLGSRLSFLIPEKTFVIIKVHASLEECLERMRNKDFSKTPYPETPDSIEETITQLDAGFRKDFDVMWADKATEIIDYYGNASELFGMYKRLGTDLF